MCKIENKGCDNCKYKDTMAHWPPCDECLNSENWEAGEGTGQEKKDAVWALWVAAGALYEAAQRTEQVGPDQYMLYARQLRGQADMAKEWIERIEGEIGREAGREVGGRRTGRGAEADPRAWAPDEDDGYCV